VKAAGAHTSQLPVVLLIDLDGTIVGDVTPHVAQYTIWLDVLKRRYDSAWLVTALRAGLLRPGFMGFMQYCRVHQPHLELFVYTASLGQWAAVVVRAIEDETGTRFNRPILTRDDCVAAGSNKSFAIVRRKVFRALKPKYGAELLSSEQQLQESFVMVDNLENVLPAEERARLITCPTYNWSGVHDVVGSVPPALLAANLEAICRVLRDNNLMPIAPPHNVSDVYGFLRVYQRHLAKTSVQWSSHNSHAPADQFWWQFCRAWKASGIGGGARGGGAADVSAIAALRASLGRQQQRVAQQQPDRVKQPPLMLTSPKHW
jgi:hypothetical protein